MKKFYVIALVATGMAFFSSSVSAQRIEPTTKNAVKVAPKSVLSGDARLQEPRRTKARTITSPGISQDRGSESLVHRIPAIESNPNAPVIYGFNYKSGDWRTPSPLASGVFSFSASQPFNFVAESTGAKFPDDPQAAFYANGKFYCITSTYWKDADYGMHAFSRIYVFNAETWQQIGDTISLGKHYPMQCATYNKANGKAYFMNWNMETSDDDDDQPSKMLCSIDLATNKVDTLLRTDNFFVFLAAAKDGSLYAGKIEDNELCKINTSTGEVTSVGKCNFTLTNGTALAEAVFDDATGELYVAALDNKDRTFLYKGDASTAQFTKVGQFPGSEHFKGLYIVDAPAKAPAAPTNIAWTFTNTARTAGNLTFGVPTTAFDGSSLSGTLTVYVSIDGNETSQTASPGDNVSLPLSLAEGNHTVSVYLGNTAGKSQIRRMSIFAGEDVPGAVGNLKLEINEPTKAATVSWTAPTTSKNNGPVDDNSIVYKVVRQPDGMVVASGISATTFTETLSGARAHYSYDVTPMSNGKEGLTASSNTIASGTFYNVPFYENFDEEGDAALWKVGDANHDGTTWARMQVSDYGMTIGTSYQTADDYLISPLIKGMTTQQAYRVSFTAHGGSFERPVKLALYLGQDDNILVTEPLKAVDIESDETGTYSGVFSIPANGDYQLLVHAYCTAYSDADLKFGHLRVEKDADIDAPAVVDNVVLTPGAQGALNAELAFKAPTKNTDGSALSSISKIEVYRGAESDTPLKTFTGVTPGQSLSLSDALSESGMQTYLVRTYGSKKGALKEVSAYVGIDIPDTVRNLKAAMPVEGKATLTWNAAAVKGLHGGYVDPSAVKYVITRWSEEAYTWAQIASNVSGTTYTDETPDIPVGKQQAYVQYGVYPVSTTGRGRGTRATTLVGQPYAQPYQESFTNAKLDTEPWITHTGIGKTSWNVQGTGGAIDPFDEDGGELKFANPGTTPQSGYLQGPRVKLSATDKSALSFYMYHGMEADRGDAYVQIYASVDDADTLCLGTFQYNDGTTGWYRHVIDLNQYTGKGNITFQIYGYTADASATLYVDQFRIDAYADNDIAIQSYDIPTRMNIGQPHQLKARVINAGSKSTGVYTVALYKDNAQVSSQQGAALAPNAVRDFVFNAQNELSEAGDSVQYSIRLDMSADGKLSNNATPEVRVYLNGPKYPRPQALTGKVVGGKASLTWQAPASSEMANDVTDDFESYESFIIEHIGDWTVYDGDKATSLYFSGPEIPNWFTPQAYQVWNRDKAGFQKFDVLKPHSGDQMLAAFSASDGQYTATPNDNWLISPEIVGGSDLSFWAKESQTTHGPETFEIMYSEMEKPNTINDDFIDSFERLATGTVNYVSWKQNAYTLPAKARYFAIRHNTQVDGMVLLLDDVTYTPLVGGNSTTLQFKGYNVYRDGHLIASNLTSPAYTDNIIAKGDYLYQVSAVWNVGESMLSDGWTLHVTDGIEQADVANNKPMDVYTPSGIRVRTKATTLNGLPKGLYIVNGKKVVVK